MPRPKTLSNDVVLAAANDLLHRSGPEALTFVALARACGLAPATLVQRFGSKSGLMQSTLLHAWDGLDRRTASVAASVSKDPEGAIALLVALSTQYGGIEAYAEGLLILREDLRNPALRARGAAWRESLCHALDACFAGVPNAPPGAGLLMASHWQGSLLWWSFEPRGAVEQHVERSLRHFVSALTTHCGKTRA